MTSYALLVVAAVNAGCAMFSLFYVCRLRRELRRALVLNNLLSLLAIRQFDAAAMASHGWRAWSGTMGTIRVTFQSN